MNHSGMRLLEERGTGYTSESRIEPFFWLEASPAIGFRLSSVLDCRAAILEPFLQRACSATASRIADSLSSQLESQPEAALGPEATAGVEEALLIGKFKFSPILAKKNPASFRWSIAPTQQPIYGQDVHSS